MLAVVAIVEFDPAVDPGVVAEQAVVFLGRYCGRRQRAGVVDNSGRVVSRASDIDTERHVDAVLTLSKVRSASSVGPRRWCRPC